MSYTNVVFKQNITRNVDRDQIEQARLNDRVGFHSKFQTAGNLIFKPEEKSTLHVNDRERFNKDFDANDRIRRNNEKQKTQQFFETRLNKRMEREQNRWESEAKKQQQSEANRLHHQKIQLENKRNINGIGFNPITQTYEQSQRGKKLQSYDEGKQVNRYVRARNLVDKNNGGNGGYDIITGQAKKAHSAIVPQKLVGRVQAKYEDKRNREAVKYEPKRDKYDYLDD